MDAPMVCLLTIRGKKHRKRSIELISLAEKHLGARLIGKTHTDCSVLRMTFFGEYGLDYVRALYPEAEIVCGNV